RHAFRSQHLDVAGIGSDVVAVYSKSPRSHTGYPRCLPGSFHVQYRDAALVFRLGHLAVGSGPSPTLAHSAVRRCLNLCGFGIFRRRQPPALYLVVGTWLTAVVVVGSLLDV